MNNEDVKKGFDLIRQGMSILNNGPLDYYVRRLTECYDLLVTRFAPFKVGDRIELTTTPVINDRERYGWLGSKHFLVEGAVATVAAVDVDGDGFSFGLHFDNDSWIDHHGQKQPTMQKGMYFFRESWVRAAKETPAAPKCDCEGPQKIGPDYHAPYCSTVAGGKELREQLERDSLNRGESL
jgi:hypothetical protein